MTKGGKRKFPGFNQIISSFLYVCLLGDDTHMRSTLRGGQRWRGKAKMRCDWA